MPDTKTTLTWILKDEVSGPARNLKGSLDDAGAAAGRGGGLFGSLGGAIGGLINPMTLAIGGAGALVGGLAMAAKAAADEQVNIEKMNTALEANIPSWDGNTDAIEAMIAKREDLAFSDDDLRNSMALLVAGTKDVSDATQLQATAMDLARLKGVSLEEASIALAKANQGSTRELKALGLEIDDNASAAENLTAIQVAAAGQAAAYADTTQAKWETLNNKFGDVVETIGTALLPIIDDLLTFIIDEVIPGIQDLADELTPELQEAIEVAGKALGWFIDNFVAPAIDAIALLVGWIISAVDWFKKLLGIEDEEASRPRRTTGSRSGNYQGGRGARQEGGPVEPWGMYTVGEAGPETLVMGASPGTIIPGGGSAWAGGTPVEIPITIDGREIARVVDEHLYYMGRQASPSQVRS